MAPEEGAVTSPGAKVSGATEAKGTTLRETREKDQAIHKKSPGKEK